MVGPNLSTKKRILFLLFLFSFAIVALIARVAWIQIVKGDWLLEMASKQQNRDREITPKRGTIYDRNGKELAISASVDRIVVNPQELKKSKKDLTKIAEKLSEILKMDKEIILTKINKQSRYEIIKKKVDREIGDLVRKLKQEDKIDGIYIDEDTKRYYPNRNLASHIIGFTGDDNQGLDGIEKTAEQYLKGVPGKILSEVDAGGRVVPFSDEERIAPKEGLNIVLTIDETIQYFAQKAIEKAIDDNKLLGGATAIVIDPKSGEVLALVSKPDFDLNNPKAAPPFVNSAEWKGTTPEEIKILQEKIWRNKAVTDTYEPGSTFKAITSAAGLEEGVINPSSPVNDFTVTVSGKKINCWKPNGHGNETFTEGVYNSCNPVFVRVSQSLGIDKFYKYVRAFGFYEKTNLMLPGEAGSIFHKAPKEIDMAVASFGQRFQITPIQLITAYAAIANDGKLIKPHLIKEMTDQEGNIVKKVQPEVVRNVVSKKTATTLREILEGVVSNGTGSNAYVKGYRVAGKTGTSETTQEGRYIASFSAIAPADDPAICVLVVLDHPSGDSYYGGVIAAPVAGRIVEDTLNYLEIERRYTEKDKQMMAEEVSIPDITDKTVEEANKILKKLDITLKVEGNFTAISTIKSQTPKAGIFVPKKSVIIGYTENRKQEILVRVPNLVNKTVPEATQILNEIGLNIKINGRGLAYNQSVKSNEQTSKGNIITVDFRTIEVD